LIWVEYWSDISVESALTGVEMKTLAFWTLIVMNIALLAVFVSRMSKSNTAQAAGAQVAGRPGDYLMIPGTVTGGVNDVVYVIDQNSHQLSAMSYDDSSHTVVPFQPRDMDRDFDAPQRNGRGR
jgi:hypothetical protein